MKKLSAFWQKNRIVLIISISILTVLLLVARKYVTLNNDVLISGLSVNVAVDQAAVEEMNAHFREQLSQGGKYEKVRLSQVSMENFSDVNLQYKDNLYTLTTIASLNETGELDYLLMDQLALESLIKQETFLDLRQFFTEEQLQELGDRVIYVRSSEMEVWKSYPVAVDISGLSYIRENTATADKVYFGIAVESPRIEQIRLVWEYLNQ